MEGTGGPSEREDTILSAFTIRGYKLTLLDSYKLQEAYNLHASNGILFNHGHPGRELCHL